MECHFRLVAASNSAPGPSASSTRHYFVRQKSSLFPPEQKVPPFPLPPSPPPKNPPSQVSELEILPHRSHLEARKPMPGEKAVGCFVLLDQWEGKMTIWVWGQWGESSMALAASWKLLLLGWLGLGGRTGFPGGWVGSGKEGGPPCLVCQHLSPLASPPCLSHLPPSAFEPKCHPAQYCHCQPRPPKEVNSSVCPVRVPDPEDLNAGGLVSSYGPGGRVLA